MLANLGLVLYAIIGGIIFTYFTIEGWISGSLSELTFKTAIGVIFGTFWGFILFIIIIWALAEIGYHLYQRKQNGSGA